jgi:hypothetical protein
MAAIHAIILQVICKILPRISRYTSPGDFELIEWLHVYAICANPKIGWDLSDSDSFINGSTRTQSQPLSSPTRLEGDWGSS